MHTIKHKNFVAQINPVGAELSSLKFRQQEYLWQGDERYWGGRAPILFPIVGALKNGQMSYKGSRYTMPRHGLARRSVFELLHQSDDTITLVLSADTDSLQQYPWNFVLQVTFTLTDNGLVIQYDILNNDNSNMLFTIGSHPAFALSVNAPADLEAYTVHIEQNEPLSLYQLNEEGLLDRDCKSFALDNIIQLNQTVFNEDALVFRDVKANTISLQRDGQRVLSVDTGGAPHLGVWAKPGAAFVCIEPWLGTSDFTDSNGQFESKEDLQSLPAGESFSHRIGVSFPD